MTKSAAPSVTTPFQTWKASRCIGSEISSTVAPSVASVLAAAATRRSTSGSDGGEPVSAPLCAKPSLTSATLRPFTPRRSAGM